MRFFAHIAGDHALERQQQWPVCINWVQTRVPVAHPVTCSDSSTRIQRLRQIQASIQTEEEYDVVREAAKAMAACLCKAVEYFSSCVSNFSSMCQHGFALENVSALFAVAIGDMQTCVCYVSQHGMQCVYVPALVFASVYCSRKH